MNHAAIHTLWVAFSVYLIKEIVMRTDMKLALSGFVAGIFSILAMVVFIFKMTLDKENQFRIEEVLFEAGWKDQFGNPGYSVYRTVHGNVLKIHGGADGKVWAKELDIHCELDSCIQELGIKVDKILCCHPKMVRESTKSNVRFFYPNHTDLLWSKGVVKPGDTVFVLDKDPNLFR